MEMVIILGLQWIVFERGQVSKEVCLWLCVRDLIEDAGIPVPLWLDSRCRLLLFSAAMFLGYGLCHLSGGMGSPTAGTLWVNRDEPGLGTW